MADGHDGPVQEQNFQVKTMPESKTILIVDDDSRNIFALSAVLKAKGFEVLSAPGMSDAFQQLNSHKNIRTILLDMMMPDMDGYQALEILKKEERYRHLKVIAVTAQAMTGDRERCMSAGADGYISKPVDVDILMDTLRNKV